jgi:hypothetical protein
MREKNLKMIRSQGWSLKISPRDLNALPLSFFSLPWFVSCTNSTDIKSLQADSQAEDDNSAPLQYEKLAFLIFLVATYSLAAKATKFSADWRAKRGKRK